VINSNLGPNHNTSVINNRRTTDRLTTTRTISWTVTSGGSSPKNLGGGAVLQSHW